VSKKQPYRIKFSKNAAAALKEDLLKMKPPKQPRSAYQRSSCYISEQLINKPYANKEIEILFDTTGENIWVYDHVHQICHSYSRDISHYHSQDGSILKIYSQLKDQIRANLNDILEKQLKVQNEIPDLCLHDGNISYNCSEGYFFDADNMAVVEDFIPCLVTPNEVIISEAACRVIGNGNVRNGGHALMMLNTIARSQDV
jgi:hypothetical protein